MCVYRVPVVLHSLFARLARKYLLMLLLIVVDCLLGLRRSREPTVAYLRLFGI